MRKLSISLILLIILSVAACAPTRTEKTERANSFQTQDVKVASLDLKDFPFDKVIKTQAEWKKILPPNVFHIMREKGTERAFSNPYHKLKEKGIYYCRACGNPLFHSATKFNSGTGWPSFYQPINSKRIGLEPDNTLFTTRTEVHCARCSGHLGHVFEDGPKPTGLRYCINALSLQFKASQ